MSKTNFCIEKPRGSTAKRARAFCAVAVIRPVVVQLFCGSSVVVLCCMVLLSEFRWHLTLCVLFSVRFELLSGHLFGKCCSLGLPYVPFLYFDYL